MNISVEEYMSKLAECMENHSEYVSGHVAKANYGDRGIELFDETGAKIDTSKSKAFIECNTKLLKEHKIIF